MTPMPDVSSATPDLPTPTPDEARDWFRTSRRVAYENPWLTIYHDEVTRPDGSPGIYGIVHFANIAAGVVAIDAEDRVALVGQFRYTMDEYSWELPEGGIPDGEDPLVGAQRELREETGVDAAEWHELARVVLSNSVTDEVAILYLATGLTHGDADPEPTEALALRWVLFDDVLSMTFDGRISDAMTVVAIQRVALARLATPALARAMSPEARPEIRPDT
jgi:8-oxo-dGTP pyrophosphatase MutT (NUDIX family)